MKYKLDRNAFSMRALEANEPAIIYWKKKSPEERLSATFYLNSVAFDFNLSQPPTMDKTVFRMRSHKK